MSVFDKLRNLDPKRKKVLIVASLVGFAILCGVEYWTMIPREQTLSYRFLDRARPVFYGISKTDKGGYYVSEYVLNRPYESVKSDMDRELKRWDYSAYEKSDPLKCASYSENEDSQVSILSGRAPSGKYDMDLDAVVPDKKTTIVVFAQLLPPGPLSDIRTAIFHTGRYYGQ